jgi:hypothetical protein
MLKRFFAITTVVLLIISTACTLHAQTTNVNGVWHVVRDGKSGTTNLTLMQTGDTVTGIWAPSKGPNAQIEDGKVVEDTFTFSFTHDKEHFTATGHISGDSMKIDITKHGKGGKVEVTHATATH